MKTILGTGQLGLAIMETLLRDHPGEAILLVNRNGKLAAAAPENVRLMAADVTDPAALEQIARKSEVIFSCTDVPYQHWATFYPAAAAALVHALRTTGTRVVFADNLYSYGNVAGAVMSESLPHAATTRKGRIRGAVLHALLEADPAIAARVAVVKSADFIGPRIHKGVFGTDFLDRLDRQKTVLLAGKLTLPHAFTYIGDFAGAMVRVSAAPDAFGQIWHVPNAPAVDLKTWLGLFERATGKKAKVRVLPKIVVRIAGLFDPLVRELYELAYQFEYPYLVNHAKYGRRFGEQYTTPETIVAETVRFRRQELGDRN